MGLFPPPSLLSASLSSLSLFNGSRSCFQLLNSQVASNAVQHEPFGAELGAWHLSILETLPLDFKYSYKKALLRMTNVHFFSSWFAQSSHINRQALYNNPVHITNTPKVPQIAQFS